jgi:hypothetical protein
MRGTAAAIAGASALALARQSTASLRSGATAAVLVLASIA